MNDSKRTIALSAASFFSGTLLSRLSGFLRDVTMAAAFGTEPAVAALLVAFRWSHFFRRLLGEGALQAAFIPLFEEIRGESVRKADQFFSDLKASLSLVLGLLIFLLASGLFFFQEIQVLQLTLYCLPGLFFICLYGLNTARLQCDRNYFIGSVAPLVFNLIWIAGIFATKTESPETAMKGLALFIVLGCALEWLVTLPAVKSEDKSVLFSKDVKRMLGPLFLGMIGVGASQINNVLDSVFALFANIEGPAFLWYALRLQQLPLALFGIALSSSLLPPLARAEKRGDREHFLKLLKFTTLLTFTLMFLATCVLCFFTKELVSLVFARGEFGVSSVEGTSLCLKAYALGLIPTALSCVLAPAFFAKKNFSTTTLASLGSVFLNVLLNAIFIFGLEWGAASVALATSVSDWVRLIFLGAVIKRQF